VGSTEMDPWEVKSFVEDLFERDRTYGRYLDLCMQVDAAPVTIEKLEDIYVDIISRRIELYEKAKADLPSDKKNLVEHLEGLGTPIEEIVTVDQLQPHTIVTINELKDGMICLFVVFPEGPENPALLLSYANRDDNDKDIFI